MPQSAPVIVQAVLVGLPAASSSPTAVALAPSLLGVPALGVPAPAVTTARPAQPVPQGATTLIGTSLAPPRNPLPVEFPVSDPQRLAPLEIEALPPLRVRGMEDPPIPLGFGGSWDDGVSAFLADEDAPVLPLDPAPLATEAVLDQAPSALAAAAAIAVWGTMEIRWRHANRRRQPASLEPLER